MLALMQLEILPGEPEKNFHRMAAAIREGEKQGAELMLFPQLALSGLLAGEYFSHKDFIEDCSFWGHSLAEHCHETAAIFGNLALNSEGGLLNTCFLAQKGRLIPLQPFMGQEDIPHAWQPFAAPNSPKLHSIRLNGQEYTLALLLGDWQHRPLPQECSQADFIIHLAAAPLNIKEPVPGHYLGARSIYVNAAGQQNRGKAIYVMAGGSRAFDEKGRLLAAAPLLEEKLLFMNARGGEISPQPQTGALIYQALVKGARGFLGQIGSQKAAIGLSGGIDSALAACVYTEALGQENVLLVNMPSQYNSSTTRGLAARLAAALNTHYTVMPIEDSITATLKQFAETGIKSPAGADWSLSPGPLALENLQARDRTGRLLATLAASWGAIFPCNSNKAELSVGYSTFYGDLAGALCTLGDLWKHQVYAASAYAEERFPAAAEALAEIAALRPSAELSPEQAVEKGQGDPMIYPYHDYLLAALVEDGRNPLDMLRHYLAGDLESYLGCQPGIVQELFSNPQDFIDDLEYWWRMLRRIGAAKRLQAPPILVLSRSSLAERPQEGQLSPYLSREYVNLRKQALGNTQA